MLDAPSNKNSEVPNKPHAEVPNMRPYPKVQKMIEAMQKSTTFLMATLILFFARTKPVSKQVNPACISKTNAVQVSIQVNGWKEELDGMKFL